MSIVDRFSPPAFDAIGRGGRIAVQDNYLFRTIWTEDMRALIDTSLGRRPSLEDMEDIRLLALGIEALGAFSAFFTVATQGSRLIESLNYQLEQDIPEDQKPLITRTLEQSLLLRPYQALASGAGKDDNERYLALVLVHADAESAQENVGLLPRRVNETSSVLSGRPWTDLIDSMDISAEGRVLLAKVRGKDIHRGWRIIFDRGDPLILHEPYETLSMQSYISDSLGFSISYPQSWQVDETDPEAVRFHTEDDAPNSPFLLVVRVELLGRSFDSYLTAYTNALSFLEGFYTLFVDPGFTGGALSSLRMEAITTEDGERVRLAIAAHQAGDSAIIITAAANEVRYPALEASFQAAIESLDIFESVPATGESAAPEPTGELPAMEVRGAVVAFKDATSDTVESVEFHVTNLGVATSEGVDLSSTGDVATVITYIDDDQSKTLDSSEWQATWLIGSGDTLDRGERAEIRVVLADLSTALGKSKSFVIEVKPARGAVLVVERTTPAELTATMILE